MNRKLNDVIENLELLTRADHLVEHKHEHEEKRNRAASEAAKRRHAANRANRAAAQRSTGSP
jgi:hypothetical protein